MTEGDRARRKNNVLNAIETPLSNNVIHHPSRHASPKQVPSSRYTINQNLYKYLFQPTLLHIKFRIEIFLSSRILQSVPKS